jgi:phage anti-repressor protein
MHFQCYYCSFPTGKYKDLISHLIENHTMDEIMCVHGRKQGREQGRTIKIDMSQERPISEKKEKKKTYLDYINNRFLQGKFALRNISTHLVKYWAEGLCRSSMPISS